MKKWNLKALKTWQMLTAAIILVILVIIVIAVFVKGKGPEEEILEEYTYTVQEQVLADEVTVYLQGAVNGIGEAVCAKTANEAVESYRLILQSDVDVVNENHTQAIQERISKVLQEYAEKDAALSGADIPALSAGVAELVWKSILSQIESVTENVEESEYFYLAESLQQEIKELEARKMKVSIRANIKNNTELTPEELLSILEGMSDEEIEALAKSLGLSLDELYQLLEKGSLGDKELAELLSKLKKELETEFDKKIEKEVADGIKGANGNNGTSGNNGSSSSASGSNGSNGRGGTNGKDGKDGQDGKDGKDGKAGQNGDSVFIMYSEESTGKNMTNKPTDSSKWMGTYIGANASSNPADYTWTRYSDATITYSDGTLYITQ